MFLNREGKPLKVERLRVYFRRYRITAECLNSVYIGGLRGKMNEFSFENKMKQKVIGLSLITGEEIEGDIITITDKNNVMELEDFVNQINTNTIK